MRIGSSKTVYLLVVVLIAAASGAHYAGWLKTPESMLARFFEPILRHSQSFSVSVGDEYRFFGSREEFFSDYRLCTDNLLSAQIDKARLELLEEENKELKAQLGYTSTQTSTTVLAHVIGYDNAEIEKTIMINQGSSAGVTLGNPVIVGKGALIGKVIRVDTETALVRLISDSRSRVEATLINGQQTMGVVEGGFGISLRMQFVPRSESILVGQQIVTSGREKLLPRGLLIGTVVTVENEAYQGFQRITLVPNTDLTKLFLVTVLLTR